MTLCFLWGTLFCMLCEVTSPASCWHVLVHTVIWVLKVSYSLQCSQSADSPWILRLSNVSVALLFLYGVVPQVQCQRVSTGLVLNGNTSTFFILCVRQNNLGTYLQGINWIYNIAQKSEHISQAPLPHVRPPMHPISHPEPITCQDLHDIEVRSKAHTPKELILL